ncbi:hypothetical protein BJ878DRAFT_411249 [Calycina marina]|uniref:Uncharacterized protein n=1 Tax=Calycina marina TaxID=1763456 RepID=A0A9P8CJA2_9HELO|nr:hypothetical protein BJ878DRAFT_411249 [Calycina marina]
MSVLPSQKHLNLRLHFLPAFPNININITWPTLKTATTTSSNSSYVEQDRSRQVCSRESGYGSTIHHRRTTLRTLNKNLTPPLPTLTGFTELFHSRAAPVLIKESRESDSECWKRMLMLQREYRCYKSARLEAAVEAMECGVDFQDIPMPSRLCLDLLNDELRVRVEADCELYAA